MVLEASEQDGREEKAKPQAGARTTARAVTAPARLTRNVRRHQDARIRRYIHSASAHAREQCVPCGAPPRGVSLKMTAPAQPHDAGQGGNRRTAQVERHDVVTLEPKPAAVRTQTARSRPARGPERLPFPAAIDGRANRPSHHTPGVRICLSDSAAPERIIAPVIDGAFPSLRSDAPRSLGLYASR